MHTDVYWQAKGDPAFRKELGRLIHKISVSEKAAIKDPVARNVFRSSLTELYRLCNYNAGFLVPHFFPAYPYTKPLSLQARPFSFSMFNMQIGGFTVMRASRQVGKCLGWHTVLTVLTKQDPNPKSVTAEDLFNMALNFDDQNIE